MTKTYIKKWLIFKGGAAFLVAFSVCYIYQVYSFAQELHLESLITQADIIKYNGKVIICIGGIPLFIWMFFISVQLLLKKSAGPITKQTVIGDMWGMFSLVSFFGSVIVSLIIPFVLIMSSYTSCSHVKFGLYYVVNPELCKTIVPPAWFKK